VEEPEQIAALELVVNIGLGFTVMAMVLDEEHPEAFIPVTVYVVDVVAVETTDVPVELLSADAGTQL
jgi:hypothetical protein